MLRKIAYNETEYLVYSESQHSLPKKIFTADDTTKADYFFQKASEGAGFVWQGDFQNAKQLLQAVQRRLDKNKLIKKANDLSMKDLFHKHRQFQSHKSQILSRLYILIDSNLKIPLSRAPVVDQILRLSIEKTFEGLKFGFLISLRELLGMIGAFEWRKNGVYVKALETKIYPHYAVFSPVRNEYLDLLSEAPINSNFKSAFDIGTGTGVIAAILAKRGIKSVVATDISDRAVCCAEFNIQNLNLTEKVKIQKTNSFPDSKADLIVCNPPWLPAKPTSSLEYAVYDPDNSMLRFFLENAHNHLNNHGEAWLIISDLAETLQLRDPDFIATIAQKNHLTVLQVHTKKPTHSKAQESDDLLANARRQEVTQLWRFIKNP